MPMSSDYEVRFHLHALGHQTPVNGAKFHALTSSNSSSYERNHATADRFARATLKNGSDNAAADLGDLYDYDKYLETRAASSMKPMSVAPTKSLNEHGSNGFPSKTSIPQTPYPRRDFQFSHLRLRSPVEPRTTLASQRRSFLLQLLSSSSNSRISANDLEKYQLVSNEWNGYFEDDAMEKRRPLLYHEYVGVYRDALKRHQQQQADQHEDERLQNIYNQKSSKSNGKTEGANYSSQSSSLPRNLSELLLANYDRSVIQQKRDEEKSAQSFPQRPQNRSHTPAASQAVEPRTDQSSESCLPHTSLPNSMVESDESELEDEGMIGASASQPLRRDQPRMLFGADDGRVMDDDGSDLREAGATASLEYAEWVKEQVDDDMDAQAARREEHMARLIQRERAERDRQQREDDEDVIEVEIEAEEERKDSDKVEPALENSPEAAESSLDPTSPAFNSSASASRSEFLELMHELFLRGYDSEWVNYRLIDENDSLEDIKDRESREQERYFEEDDEEPMRE